MLKSRLNLLIAEDNADDVFFLEQALKKGSVNYRLNSVCDGLEALAYLNGEGSFADREAHPFPDILLLDLNMPGMNGFEVLEWLRKDSRCTRLVVHVLSASSRDLDIQRAYELHANSYVVKPSRVDELAAFVRALGEWHKFLVLPRCE
jgi:CheY-like chemotaxis protein